MTPELSVVNGGKPLADLHRLLRGLYHACRVRLRDPIYIGDREYSRESEGDVCEIQHRILSGQGDLDDFFEVHELLVSGFVDADECGKQDNMHSLVAVTQSIITNCVKYGALVMAHQTGEHVFLGLPTHPDFNLEGGYVHYGRDLTRLRRLARSIVCSCPDLWEGFSHEESYRQSLRNVREELQYQGY